MNEDRAYSALILVDKNAVPQGVQLDGLHIYHVKSAHVHAIPGEPMELELRIYIKDVQFREMK